MSDKLTFVFNGYGEAWLSVDPADYAGLSAEEVAETLQNMASEDEGLDFSEDLDQFNDAAETILAELEKE